MSRNLEIARVKNYFTQFMIYLYILKGGNSSKFHFFFLLYQYHRAQDINSFQQVFAHDDGSYILFKILN